jgi:hypothetical protein
MPQMTYIANNCSLLKLPAVILLPMDLLCQQYAHQKYSPVTNTENNYKWLMDGTNSTIN